MSSCTPTIILASEYSAQISVRSQTVQSSAVLSVKKFKFEGVENLGHAWTNKSVSQKVQIFGEGNILMKGSILCGCFDFQKFYLDLRWG